MEYTARNGWTILTYNGGTRAIDKRGQYYDLRTEGRIGSTVLRQAGWYADTGIMGSGQSRKPVKPAGLATAYREYQAYASGKDNYLVGG